MNVDDLVAGLDSVSERNDTLSFLESLVVDIDGKLVRSIIDVIKEPSSVENTNRFASLLKSLGSEAFIPPLIEVISTGSPVTLSSRCRAETKGMDRSEGPYMGLSRRQLTTRSG